MFEELRLVLFDDKTLLTFFWGRRMRPEVVPETENQSLQAMKLSAFETIQDQSALAHRLALLNVMYR